MSAHGLIHFKGRFCFTNQISVMGPDPGLAVHCFALNSTDSALGVHRQ